MIQARPPICPYCRQPMKLFRTVSKAASPLFVFHCSPCNHTTTKQQQQPPVRDLSPEVAEEAGRPGPQLTADQIASASQARRRPANSL